MMKVQLPRQDGHKHKLKLSKIYIFDKLIKRKKIIHHFSETYNIHAKKGLRQIKEIHHLNLKCGK